MRSRWLVAPAVVGVAVVGALATGLIEVGTADWDRARPAGDSTLRVTYAGGECETWAWASARETPRRVVVTVRTVTVAASCSDVGVERFVEVDLHEPLGGRRVVAGR